jgi:hypothetical protein
MVLRFRCAPVSIPPPFEFAEYNVMTITSLRICTRAFSFLALMGLASLTISCFQFRNDYTRIPLASYPPLLSAYSAYLRSGESAPGARRASAFEDVASKLSVFVQNPGLTRGVAEHYLGEPDLKSEPDVSNPDQWIYIYYRESTHTQWIVGFIWDKNGVGTETYWAEKPTIIYQK